MRSDAHAEVDAYVEVAIHEAMWVRLVIPSVGRVAVPWQLGGHRVPAGTLIAMGVVLLHHRADVNPQPFAFEPQRLVGVKPCAYTWIPCSGGVRRCLQAMLAMTEQRIAPRAIEQHTDMHALDHQAERLRRRNVTMRFRDGTRVVLDTRRPS